MDLENTANTRASDPVASGTAESLNANSGSANSGPDVSPSAISGEEADGTAGIVTTDGVTPETDVIPPPQTMLVETVKGEGPRNTIAEWAITILLLLFLTTTLVQAYVIPTGSMEDTLLIGDHLLVDKLAYAPAGPVSRALLPYRDVKRGDIIVFRYPADLRMTFVKRAIGIPGDHIRIIRKDVYLNGVKLNEPYKVHKTDYLAAYRDDFPADPDGTIDDRAAKMLHDNVTNGEMVVPPNSYFAMGDNRDNSLDSRYWGFVPRENIIGKPLIIYWSYDAPSDELQDPAIGWRHALDVGRNFFSKTRWSRTFQLIHAHPIP